MKNYLQIVHIDSKSLKPIYLQLAESLVEGIQANKIEKGDALPSLHDLCIALDISKNTVEKAYNTLKKRGIVGAYKGKGYFIRG